MPEEICRGPRRSAGRAARGALGRAPLGLLLALAASAPATPAWAEPTIAERARADAPRREAQALLASDRPDVACPKLEESERLRPSTETKLELARCHERAGRLASAWALYTEIDSTEAAGGDAKRGAEARERAAAIAQELPTLAIVVSDEVKALPGLAVTLDGVAERELGAARPVEPGKHRVTASAPGRQAFSREVEARQPGELVEVHVRVLQPHAAAPAPPAGDLERRGPMPYGQRPDSIHRDLMWVTGGLTLAGIALGSTFGGLAISTWDKVEDKARTTCREPGRYLDCAQPVPDLARRAMSYATVSDFSFIAAGAALAGTAVLWLTLPPDGPRASARVQIAPGVLGGSVVGVF